MELYPARLHRGRGEMGRGWAESEAVEEGKEMKVRMKKLNEKEKGNKQSKDCDKQGGGRGKVYNLKTTPKFSLSLFPKIKLQKCREKKPSSYRHPEPTRGPHLNPSSFLKPCLLCPE